MLIEIPEPRDRPHGDPHKAIHSGPYQRAGNRLGKVTAISLQQQSDGTTSVHVMTPADNSGPYQKAGNRLGKVTTISLDQQHDGTTSVHVMTPADNSSPPYLTYTRRPDGTIHMTKHGLTHHGPITGTDHDPKRELIEQAGKLLTQEMAISPAARRVLARALTTSSDATNTGHYIAAAAIGLVNDALQQPESPDQSDPTQDNPLQDTINKAVHKHGIQEALTRAVRKHIIDGKLLSLLPGAKNQHQLDDHRYNLIAGRKDELLALHASCPDMLSYHLIHTWHPEKGHEIPTTQETLEQAIADTLHCTGAARTLLVQGLRDGTWSKLKPDDVSRICRFAGMLGDGQPKPATINAVRELRKQIPDPRLIKKDKENRLYHIQRVKLEILQYWLQVLHLYDMDHDPAQSAEDLKWMKVKAAEIGRRRSAPRMPDPGTTTWKQIRAE